MSEENVSLVVFDPLKAIVADLVKKDEAQVFNHTTPDGEKELRSWVRRVRGYKVDIEKTRKTTKANALAFGRKVDALAKELSAVPERIIQKRMEPLNEIAAKKRAEDEALAEAKRLEEERIEQERLDAIAKQEAEIAAKQVAIQAEENRLTREREILEAEKRAEKEAKEREEQLRVNAKLEAEAALKQAEMDRQKALAKAEREKAEAIEAEKEKARQAERDRLAKQEAENAEKNRLADIETKRVANVNHRKKIEKEVQSLFLDYGINIATATKITADISRGIYPTLTINY